MGWAISWSKQQLYSICNCAITFIIVLTSEWTSYPEALYKFITILYFFIKLYHIFRFLLWKWLRLWGQNPWNYLQVLGQLPSGWNLTMTLLDLAIYFLNTTKSGLIILSGNLKLFLYLEKQKRIHILLSIGWDLV